MTRPRPVVSVVLAAVVASAWLVPGPAATGSPGEGPDLEPAPDVTWREVLDRAVTATATGYEASMVVVSVGPDGPGVTEVELRKDADGGLSVAASEAWLIARDESSAMFRDEPAGRLLRLGQVQSLPFTLPEVEHTYDIDIAGRTDLMTGSATAVAFRRGDLLRERLFVDDTTGLVVRRETYDGAGQPVRVMALTEVRVTDVDMETMEATGDPALGTRTRLSPDEVRQMAGHAWQVPTTVGDGFDLRAGYAVDDGAAVQLVYSDGLYTLSVFEQPGRVDAGALEGAVHVELDGIPVYRWPGVEPQRMVWNGDGHTFTAVTDAPMDVLMSAVQDLPHDPAPALTTRIRRGFARLGHWLWPFG